MTVRSGSPAAPAGDGWIAEILAHNDRLDRELREFRAVSDAHSIAALTDRRGIILDLNDKFCEVSKFTRAELIGAPQNIVNSGHHSREFWREMWATIGRGGTWQGEVCNRAKDGSEYWVATTIVPILDDRGRPERYFSLRTETTELHLASRRLSEVAYVDPLTGLPNRAAVLQRLDGCVRNVGYDHEVLIMVALEDLGVLNDAFGYAEGDRLLLSTADRLRTMQPEPATVARVDNAVFAVMFDGLGADAAAARATAQELAERVTHEASTAIRLNLGFSLEPSLRVGFAMCDGRQSHGGFGVYQQAEIARRRAAVTREGHRPRSFEPSMVDELRERTELLLELRGAISRGELCLFVQPIVGADARVEGFEALARWRHPTRGLLSPAVFIPLAEQSGFIVELGAWVLDEACRLLGEWAQCPKRRHLQLSVNVSERQLTPTVFPATVRRALDRHGVPPERLKLEVTESLLHDDLTRSTEVLRSLRELGVQVALDDFGTGHSTLSYLVQLPVDQLKLDQSFVAPITEHDNGEALVRAVVELAHALRLSVVVEGVETAAQFETLKRLGVDAYQGYLFGKPLPPGEALAA